MSKLNKENYKMFINGEWVDSEDKLVLNKLVTLANNALSNWSPNSFVKFLGRIFTKAKRRRMA